MKKLIAVTGSILIVCLLISGAILPAMSERRETSTQRKTEINSQRLYIVKEYNGKIAVFEKGNDTPFKTTEMQISLLPDYDKQMLQAGIEVNGQGELNTLLEDYLG